MSFLKDSISYSTSTLSVQIISLFRGIAIRIILIPEILGIYNMIQVVLGFVTVFDFGASAAASRDLPILRGNNDFKNESLMRGTVLWFTLGQSAIVGLGTIIYSIFFNTDYFTLGFIGFIIVVILLLIGSIVNCYDIFLRSSQKYIGLSKIIFIIAIFEAISFISGAFWAGINGLLIGVVVSAIFKLILFFIIGYKNGIIIKIQFSFAQIKDLLSYGFPLRLIDYPMQYMLMVDLLWVTKFMNISSLAIYTTAQIFFKQSNQISSSIGSVFETRIIQYYGKYKSWKKIGEIIKNYMYLQLLVFVPILVCFCATFIPLIIRQFLPKYQDANQAIIYLLLANFFIVTNSGLTIPWFTKKKLISRGISNLLGLSLMIFFLCFFWFVLEKQDLISISISVTLSYLFYFIYMLIMVGKELWFTNEIFKICFTIIIAAIWTGFVVHLGYYYSIDGLNIFSDIIRSIIVFILSLIGISPIFIFGLKASNYSKFIKILD